MILEPIDNQIAVYNHGGFLTNFVNVALEDEKVTVTTEIVDELMMLDNLTYASYKANRGYSPDVTPEQWLAVYPTALEMEKRLQEGEK